MIVTVVTVFVKPDRVEDFITATRKNAEASLQEPGNLRFDFLQAAADPCRFALYEAYADKSDVAAHKETAHYLAWRDAVTDWMARPREGVAHAVLCPRDPERW
ncbi:MAG: antibiotic biosynthesis monooxygenase [Elusimicrobia bacterium GWA2_69_24]|nr:MAG: antibiotic biosynthesis monooxygenase [Elusimicrobia bacterium GWA2_69_24]HBL16287.1 antibiotic biosynthesis monooxygenase [Elusimicrobiota bacterium]